MHRRVVFRRIRAQIVAIVRVYVALHGGGGGGRRRVPRREHKTVEHRERIKEIEFRERGDECKQQRRQQQRPRGFTRSSRKPRGRVPGYHGTHERMQRVEGAGWVSQSKVATVLTWNTEGTTTRKYRAGVIGWLDDPSAARPPKARPPSEGAAGWWPGGACRGRVRAAAGRATRVTWVVYMGEVVDVSGGSGERNDGAWMW